MGGSSFRDLIPPFGIMQMVGFTFSCVSLLWILRRSRYKREDVYSIFSLYFKIIAIAFLFGKVLYLAFDLFLHNAINFDIFESSSILFSIYGILLYRFMLKGKRSGVELFDCLNLIAIPILLWQCIGKIGCYRAGCCFGSVNLSYLMSYFTPNDVIIPVQLFESACLFLLFLVFYAIFSKHTTTKYLWNLYIISYGLERVVAELFRKDSLLNLGTVSIYLILSLILIIIGIVSLSFEATFRLRRISGSD